MTNEDKEKNLNQNFLFYEIRLFSKKLWLMEYVRENMFSWGKYFLVSLIYSRFL